MKFLIYSENLTNFVDQYWIDIVNIYRELDIWTIIAISSQDALNKLVFHDDDIVMFNLWGSNINIPNINCYKILWLCDMHLEYHGKWILDNVGKSNLIITPNSLSIIKKHSYMDNKSYITSNWGVKKINSLVLNDTPINKVLVSGNCDKNYYPLRVIAEKFSKTIVDVLKHPSYSSKLRHNIIGDKYIFHLNTYICCFCDASSLRIILKKIYEILYSGSLLLAESVVKKELEEQGIIENVHCILCDENNMLQQMLFILDEKNREIINNIRTNGFKLASTNFLLKTRIDKLNKDLETYIN